MVALLSACAGDKAAGTRAPKPAVIAASRAVGVDVLPLVPGPRATTSCAGMFEIRSETAIAFYGGEAARPIATMLARWLGVDARRLVALSPASAAPPHAVVLRLVGSDRDDPSTSPPSDTATEAYSLDVGQDHADVLARRPRGLFYGAQTLARLALSRPIGGAAAAPLPRHVPCVHVEDAPRFAFRAMHLDVARHFFTKEVVERYVDLLAYYNFNVFHWHLTDDQAFRLEVRSHPELTAVGARRTEPDGSLHAGSYTQDDARAVVAYARDRFVTVVPEIEMPGHARAILASHPELSCTGAKMDVPATWGVFDDVLCAGNDGSYALLDDVLRAVTEVFPSKLVHVGGDEVPKTRWNACPKCRAKMTAEHADAEGLQGLFLRRIATTLAARGKRVLAWDEAMDGGLPSDGVAVAWRGPDRTAEAARRGHDVVAAPYESVYFDYVQAPQAPGTGPGQTSRALPWTKVLAFDPRPSGIDDAAAKHVLGGEGALWTEYVKTQDDIDRLVVPRMAALAEALWSGAHDDSSFASRFTASRDALDASAVRYFVEPPVGLRQKKVFLDSAEVAVRRSRLFPDGVVRYTTDGSDPSSISTAFGAPLTITATTDVAARVFLPNGRASDVVRGRFEKQTPAPALAPVATREGVNYTYYETDAIKALPDFAQLVPKKKGVLPAIGFDASFRAERFAVVYEGLVSVPASGVFRFVALSDDGVALEVDGQRVLEDDGAHAARDADGEVALAAGLHRVRLLYFQGGGGKELSLRCEGPSLPLGPCAIVVAR